MIIIPYICLVVNRTFVRCRCDGGAYYGSGAPLLEEGRGGGVCLVVATRYVYYILCCAANTTQYVYFLPRICYNNFVS